MATVLDGLIEEAEIWQNDVEVSVTRLHRVNYGSQVYKYRANTESEAIIDNLCLNLVPHAISVKSGPNSSSSLALHLNIATESP